MTADRAIKLLQNELACVETDACDHHCDDCMLAGNQDEIVEALNMAMGALKEWKAGMWLKISPAGIYECSECGQMVMTSDIDCYKRCHRCGAYMEVQDANGT